MAFYKKVLSCLIFKYFLKKIFISNTEKILQFLVAECHRFWGACIFDRRANRGHINR